MEGKRGSPGGARGARGSAGKPRISPRIAAMKAAKREEMKRAASTSSAGGASPAVLVSDPFQIARDAKDVLRGETGVVYDEEMLKHANPWDPDHIESPRRLERSLERCRELGLLDRCRRLPTRLAQDAELLLAHSRAHLDAIQEIVSLPTTQEKKDRCLRRLDDSVFMNEHSLRCARMGTAAAVDLASAVYRGELQNGMVLVRPPGHHASRDEILGFCLTNHVAIAARHLLSKEGASRIMVVDFDVHHGQATQREFYDDPSLLYVSIHRHEHGRYWPHLRESDYDCVGSGSGAGFNVNVPINETGLQNSDYLSIFHQIILPLGYEFNPEIVLVSAGFDAALGCPEGEMELSPVIYGHFISSLMSLASGKVAAVLEGGYFVESLAEGVAMTMRALLGEPSFSLGTLGAPKKTTRESVFNVLSAARSRWTMLRVQDEYSISTYDAQADKGCHEPMLVYEGEAFVQKREENKESYNPDHYYWTHSEEKNLHYLDVLQKIKCTYSGQLYAEVAAGGGLRKKRLALVYDPLMKRHRNMSGGAHPERPDRVGKMWECLQEYGILKRPEVMQIDSRRATKEELLLCHEERHYDEMASIPGLPGGQRELERMGDQFDSIYLNPDSFDCALLSAGCLLNLVDCVCNGDSLRGAAVVRPPGHHAEAGEACGFCLFNNVAVAAKYALENHELKRVLILDWDVHHGNGIQNMFYDDDRVLYISLHRFDWGTFFPGRPEAGADFAGEGRGEGYNVNVPWNGPGMGDPEYLTAFFSAVLPICYQFDPEFVLVSAGFDAARGDPLGNCKVSPEMYGHMTQQLCNLAGGRVIVALEGGYNLNSISLSMTMCCKALLGDPMPPPGGGAAQKPKKGAVQSVRDVIRVHSRYWSCLRDMDKRLPDSFEDLKEGLEKAGGEARKNEKSPAKPPSPPKLKSPPPSKPTPYIPSEYGHHDSTFSVTTMSNCSLRTQPRETDSGRETPKKEEDGDVLKGLGGLSLGALGADSYVPGEYGSASVGSNVINTFSRSNASAKCEVTGSAKQCSSSSSSAEKRDQEENGQK